jgi:2-iminobutanoate/2-iminopropanoate deaminase
MSSTIVKKIISTSAGPPPVGPYNQAVVVDRTVYLSGACGIDNKTNKLVPGGVIPETIKALENVKILLHAAGSKIDNVIKCTVLLSDINDFAAVNQEYMKGLFVFLRHL